MTAGVVQDSRSRFVTGKLGAGSERVGSSRRRSDGERTESPAEAGFSDRPFSDEDFFGVLVEVDGCIEVAGSDVVSGVVVDIVKSAGLDRACKRFHETLLAAAHRPP